MRIDIRDRGALLAVSSAVSAHVRAAGSRRPAPCRVHSDVHVGEPRPEIIVPRTEHLGGDASVVTTPIETFAEVGAWGAMEPKVR